MVLSVFHLLIVAQNMCRIWTIFFQRLTKFDLKLAPKKARLGVKIITFLGPRVTAKGMDQIREK